MTRVWSSNLLPGRALEMPLHQIAIKAAAVSRPAAEAENPSQQLCERQTEGDSDDTSSQQTKTSCQETTQNTRAQTTQQCAAVYPDYFKWNDREIRDGLQPPTRYVGQQPQCSTENKADSLIKLAKDVLVDTKCWRSHKDNGDITDLGGCQRRGVHCRPISTENIMDELMDSGQRRISDLFLCGEVETTLFLTESQGRQKDPEVGLECDTKARRIVPEVSNPSGKDGKHQVAPELLFTFGFAFGFALGISEERTRASRRPGNDISVCPSKNSREKPGNSGHLTSTAFDSELRMTPTFIEEVRTSSVQMKQGTVGPTKSSDFTALTPTAEMEVTSDLAILDISTSPKNNKGNVFKQAKNNLVRENSKFSSCHSPDDMMVLISPMIARGAQGGLMKYQADAIQPSSARLVNVSSPDDENARMTYLVTILEFETCPDWIVLDLHSFSEGEEGSIREQGQIGPKGFRNRAVLRHEETKEEASVGILDSCEEAIHLEEEMAVVWQSQPDAVDVEGESDGPQADPKSLSHRRKMSLRRRECKSREKCCLM